MLKNTIINSYGVQVKKRIVELGITQKELAKKADVPEKYLSKIITGQKKGWKYRDRIDEILKNTKSRRIV